MSILDDYREWKSRREERIGTHSDRCHLWRGHEACMIHRLAAELESTARHIELAEAAWLRETSGNLPVAATVEPVAWGVMDGDHLIVGYYSTTRARADRWAIEFGFTRVVPLYTHPRKSWRLTDAEREAVEYVCRNVLPDGSREGDDAMHSLRGLLKRHSISKKYRK